MDRPIVQATLQAGVLAGVSNVLAQTVAAYQNNKPATLDPIPVYQFMFFALVNTPPNFVWQQYLESAFPGFDVRPAIVASEKKSATGEATATEVQPRRKLNVPNTAAKFALDQTVGACLNTVFYLAVMAALKGARGLEVVESVKLDFWLVMRAGWKFWPAVSLLSFTMVPVQHRILVGSIAGLGWGVLVSLLAMD